MQDITTLPRKLDARLDALDTDAAVRPTTIEAGDVWTRISQAQLLGSASTAFLDAAAQDAERAKAFDLLDALSLSGALAIESAELHMIVAATHRSLARSLARLLACSRSLLRYESKVRDMRARALSLFHTHTHTLTLASFFFFVGSTSRSCTQ